VIEVLKKHIELNDSAQTRGILIDGYPRTEQQIHHYETHASISLCYIHLSNYCLLQDLSIFAF